MRKSLILCGAAAFAMLSACATKPDPEPIIEEKPMVEAPKPVEPTPTPIVEATPDPIMAAPDPNLPIPGTAEDFAYQSGGEPRVFFGYDQYSLTPEARSVLSRQASWLQLYSEYSAVVEGHADERGTREYNLALGGRRAAAVKDYLVSQGVATSRLRTVSYGKERPIDPRSNNEGWSRNRNGHTNLNSSGPS